MDKNLSNRNISTVNLISYVIILFTLLVTIIIAWAGYRNKNVIEENISTLHNLRPKALMAKAIQFLNKTQSHLFNYILTGDDEQYHSFYNGLMVETELVKLINFRIEKALHSRDIPFPGPGNALLIKERCQELKNELDSLFALSHLNKEMNENISREDRLSQELNVLKLLFEMEKNFEYLRKLRFRNEKNRRETARIAVFGSIRNLFRYSTAGFIVILLLSVLILVNLNRVNKVQRALALARLKAEQEGEAKEKFLAYMSHEMRTPLFTVAGFTEELSNFPFNEPQKGFLNIIRESVELLLLVTEEILDISSISKGKLKLTSKDFQPGNILEQVKKSFASRFLTKGIEFDVKQIGSSKLVLHGDSFRLRQVLNNLVSNAHKYSESGKVTVECAVHRKNDEAVLLARVSDQGIGISKEGIKNLFDPYSRIIDNKLSWQSGAGLGLAISKKILEMQGGRIWVESTEGLGSEFFFEIKYPVSKKPLTDSSVKDGRIDSSVLKGMKILFVDDNEINVLLFKTMVLRWDINFDIASNGKEALQLIHGNSYDVVLSDVFMPEMDGFELAENIRSIDDKVKANLPVITITADVISKDDSYYERHGITDFLKKPYRAVQLFNLLCKYYC